MLYVRVWTEYRRTMLVTIHNVFHMVPVIHFKQIFAFMPMHIVTMCPSVGYFVTLHGAIVTLLPYSDANAPLSLIIFT